MRGVVNECNATYANLENHKIHFIHCMENTFNAILLIGTTITGKNTRMFYTRSKYFSGFSVL